MAYRVEIQPPAMEDISAAFAWVRDHAPAPERAEAWLRGLLEAIQSLSEFPRRCALAPEHDAFREDIRQMAFGRRSQAYRVLFVIADDTVSVLHVRHAARAPLSPGDQADA